MVIPFKVDTNVLGWLHVKFDGVIFPDGCYEMVNIGFVFVFYTKIINKKGKRNPMGFMFEKTWGISFNIIKFAKVSNKVIMCNLTGFL